MLKTYEHGIVYHGILRLYPAKAHRNTRFTGHSISTEFCAKQRHEIGPWYQKAKQIYLCDMSGDGRSAFKRIPKRVYFACV